MVSLTYHQEQAWIETFKEGLGNVVVSTAAEVFTIEMSCPR